MNRGRRPKPTAIRRLDGNPGKRGFNANEPEPPPGCPDCPDCPPHMDGEAREEWHRLAPVLHEMGVLTLADRAAFAAYCQAWARWVEAEVKLKHLPAMVRTPNGHVQQNPWIGVANRQLELMGRFAVELGLTPSARTRLDLPKAPQPEPISRIEFVVMDKDEDGNWTETPVGGGVPD